MEKKPSLFKRLNKRQWSYLYAGIAFGVAQIIYILGVWIYKVQVGKVPTLSPISVTTDLGRMFRSLEVFINNIFGFHSELYGNYAEIGGQMIPSGGVFTPGIGWPIVGMIIGGYIVTRMEGEHKSWAYYSKKALLVSFIGGAFFSYGTRLAGGCTLTHLMGGIPVMGIRSTFTIMFMAIGGGLGFLIMEKMGLANYFKHQETLAYVKNADKGEQATYKPGYKPFKNPFYWIGLIFSVIFILAAIYGAVIGPDFMSHASTDGALLAFGKSASDKSVIFVVLTLISGIIAGIALAKSGFGTECSLVSIETANSMTKNDKKYAKMGVPKITRTLMRSYTPMIGVVTSWVVLTAFLVGSWYVSGISPKLGNSVKSGLTAGNFIGGLFLGIGAVTLIGCEIRSYMRIGMGYLNTLVGFIGFAVGYLPYTLFYHGHKKFLESTVIFGKNGLISEHKEWYSLISEDPAIQKFIMLIWLQLIILLLVYLVRKGSKNIGLTPSALIHKNTEDIQVEIEEISEGNTMINGVPVPEPVPEDAYAKA